MKVHKKYPLLVVLLFLLMLAAGCGAPLVNVPNVLRTPAAVETISPTAEPPTIDAPTDTPVIPETPTDIPQTAQTPAPADAPTEEPLATTPAPQETVASHPLPLDQPWIQAGYRLVTPGGAEFELQDEPTEFPPMGLEVAPDGSRVAYTQNGPGWSGLVVRDLRDGAETRLPGQTFRAIFSPDSQMITYSVIDQTGWSLLKQELPDGEPQVIAASTTEQLLGPVAWTADGILAERIIWASDAPPQRLEMVDPEDGTISPIRDADHLQARPAPDGTRIAFITGRYPMGSPGEAGIVVLNQGAGSEQQIVPQQSGMISSLGWSPDASLLFYATFSFVEFASVPNALHIVSADSSNDRMLAFDDTNMEGTYRDAAWRDNGTLLVLTGDAAGTLRLYEIAAADLTMTNSATWEGAVTAQSDPAAFVRVPQP